MDCLSPSTFRANQFKITKMNRFAEFNWQLQIVANYISTICLSMASNQPHKVNDQFISQYTNTCTIIKNKQRFHIFFAISTQKQSCWMLNENLRFFNERTISHFHVSFAVAIVSLVARMNWVLWQRIIHNAITNILYFHR